jgi:hypothetical protein
MAKRKVSQKRIQDLGEWVLKASDQTFYHAAGLITPSLRKAAETFRLDPECELHREILLRILSELMFGQGKPGRPRDTLKWYPPREYDLGYHFYQLKQERPNITYSQAAKIIMKRYPNEYTDCKESALRQRMAGAYAFFEECQEFHARVDAEIAADREKQKRQQGEEIL